MVPFFKKNPHMNLEWFLKNEYKHIEKYFVETKKILLRRKDEVQEDEDNVKYSNLVSNMVGVIENNFNNYVMSGQCIIANFGFVPEQPLHTDYKPPSKYEWSDDIRFVYVYRARKTMNKSSIKRKVRNIVNVKQ